MLNNLNSLWSYAFRPFFLLGAVGSIAVMTLWTLALTGHGPAAGLPDPMLWHAHEMLFGFVVTIIAGFTLTAVAQWTGRSALHGAPLLWLAGAWLAGRAAMLLAGTIPAQLVAGADMLFPGLLLVLFGREILAAKNLRNYPLVTLVCLLAIFNGIYHFGLLTFDLALARMALLLTLHVVLLLITLIAGRIVPAFTANWLRTRGAGELPVTSSVIDTATLALTAITGALLTFMPDTVVTGSAAIVTAALHVVRLSRWQGWATRHEPLLCILHIAYAWLPIGYALIAWSVFSADYPLTVALHGLTMGAIGGMILAMITRVSLGHTGRTLRASKLTIVAYVLLMGVVMVRIIGPWTGVNYMLTVETSAVGWILTFTLFIFVYWPILSRPRVDQSLD